MSDRGDTIIINMEKITGKRIVILLFDRLTALDAVGPYEVLSRLPGYSIILAGKERRGYKDPYGLEITATHSLDEIRSADILLVPGGYGIDSLITDDEILQWIRAMDQSTLFTVSVCSGSIVLAAAGLLDGRRCTTHWRRIGKLKEFNVTVEEKRYVHDGKYITSAGVSAGIDMALYLASLVAGETTAMTIQLSIEYDPQPPFDCGNPSKAPIEIINRIIQKK
ncbi:MAG TPA: DJ-1/PfpI family protein [Cyclobacteriaceae bacterium]|nr:DJ-1/PfpI family protein [Cyclobacteriaceae bacterium]